jgi:sorbitol/mannitol transport system substrate-binding protein
MKKYTLTLMLLSLFMGVFAVSAQDTVELTIATVNNPDMVVMEGFSDVFEEAYPGITLNWVVLPENELRDTVTTDVATGASSFDVITVGMFDTPIFAQNEWILSIDATGLQQRRSPRRCSPWCFIRRRTLLPPILW